MASVKELSVKELRAGLRAANVSYEGCVEKSDLLALFEAHNLSADGGAAAPATPVDVSEPPPAPAPKWAAMSAKELRKYLTSQGISVDGCFEHSDFVERAERHLSGGPAAEADGGAMDRLKREGEARREEAMAAKQALAKHMDDLERRDREAKGAAARAAAQPEAKPVGFGGYHLDMFGVLRGKCLRDDSCWRFDPPPLTAGRVLGSNVCRRCGKGAQDHESFGSKKDKDEPDMVDEKGQCWKIRVSGGGGAHDSATYTYELMKGVEPPIKESLSHVAPVARRTGAAAPEDAAKITASNANAAPPPKPAQLAEADAAAEEAARAARLRAARDVD